MPNGNLMDDLELEEEIKSADPIVLARVTARTMHFMAKEVKTQGLNVTSLRAEMKNRFDNLPCRDIGVTVNCTDPKVAGKYGVRQLLASVGLSGPVWILLYLVLKAVFAQKLGITI
jgi:hypothetical protein